MSERGVIAVDRGLFGHARFADEPFTQREAWIWMIGQAAFRPHCKNVAGVRVTLRRGEFAHSTRFMAEKWQWSQSSVRRFLDKLGAEIDGDGAMIGSRSDAGITVVSIRNYDAYQASLFPDGAPNGAENGAGAVQQRLKEESIATDSVGGGESATPRKPDVLAEDIDLARAALTAKGDSPDSPSVMNLTYQAAAWRTRGIPRAEILATFAEIADKAEKFSLSYYIAAVNARERRKRDRPPPAAQPHLPLSPVIISSTERSHGQLAGNSATTWQQSKDNWRRSRAEFKAGLAAAESASVGDSEADGPPVRPAASA